jgi:hypothetical protein
MKDNFDDLVNTLLSKTLFEAPAAPVEEPQVEPDVKPDTKPLPTPGPQKPLVPKRHPLQPTRPDVKPRPQATDKGPISPDVAAFLNARK